MQKLLVVCPMWYFGQQHGGFGVAREAPARERIWVEREAHIMGTRLRIVLAAHDRGHGFAAIERAFSAVRRADALLSTWRSDSELARVNAATPGAALAVSEELWATLQESADWADRTGRAFDPAIGALIDVWGFRGIGRVPTGSQLAEALRASGWAQFAFDGSAMTIARRNTASWIDSGAFGKGAALRSVVHALIAEGIQDALVDFGGQVVTLGAPDGKTAWRVGLAHPAERDRSLRHLWLSGLSVATTGQSERYVEADGRRWGHVLDPRTGRPVEPWGAVSVVAADPLVADVLSTALFVLGPEAGIDWATARRDIGVVFLILRGDDVVVWANQMADHLFEPASLEVRG